MAFITEMSFIVYTFGQPKPASKVSYVRKCNLTQHQTQGSVLNRENSKHSVK